jgi:hypothetical protein
MHIGFLKTPHWHDKGFTLLWSGLNARWVLVHFKNGQSKRWYKRTERSYRFKRWFIRKGEDSFSNLANIHSPKVTLYVFRWIFSFPRKMVIPMQVNALRVREPEPALRYPAARIHVEPLQLKQSNTNTRAPRLQPNLPAFERKFEKTTAPSIGRLDLTSDFDQFKHSQTTT